MTGPRLLIVADDLTGALDSAGEAARMGIPTRVYLSPEALAAEQGSALPPVLAVSTGSRDGSAPAAIRAIQIVCACLPWLSPTQVMKKVDSRLKGHVAAECGVLAEALGLSRMMAAPALPDMGRIQQGGLLTGCGIRTPIDIATCFHGMDTFAPDITGAGQMQQAACLPGLPVGARALAAALVAKHWPDARPADVPPIPGPAILAIGSRDPITLTQIRRLTLQVQPAPDGHVPHDIPPAPVAVQMVPGGRPRPAAEAGSDFAHGLTRILQDGGFATLIACGGETAGAILARLDVGYVGVLGLALPGIPVARMTLPDGRDLCVVTKSGGFGGPDTLAHLVDLVDNPATRIATRNYGITV